MAQTPQHPNPGAIRDANFNPSPLTVIVQTSQGKESKPVPPKQPTFSRSLKPAPTPVTAPGVGTI